MRMLVAGSRFFADTQALRDAMDRAAGWTGRRVTVVHGRCDPRHAWGERARVPWNVAMTMGAEEQQLFLGADWKAGLHALRREWKQEPHAADWRRLGRSAGFVRNARMVFLGADVAIVALAPGEANRGTRMCADLAEEAGIPVVWVPPPS